MSWFFIAILSYFLNAFAAVVDKFLLQKIIGEPIVYAFLISAFGILALVFVPFDFQFPGLPLVAVSFLAAAIFTAALICFYSALKRGEASRIVPVVGGANAVFVFILAWPILGEALTLKQMASFFLILAGGFFIAREKGASKIDRIAIVYGLFAAIAFALSHVLAKFVYVSHTFISGFIWRSLGSFLAAVFLITLPRSRKKILSVLRVPKIKGGLLFFGGQGSAALSFFLLNYAFTLGPIALVNALSGVQYLFLFLMVISLSSFLPRILKEDFSHEILWNKIAGTALIFGGIFFLFV